MSKILTIAAVATLLLVFYPPGTASAQFKGTASGQGASTGGKCPNNTCAKDGSGFAKYLKNCSAANCRK